MKTMKKLFALLLALTMVFGLAATAFADETTTAEKGPGTITISPAYVGQTYDVYRIFDVTIGTDAEGNANAYSYRVRDWDKPENEKSPWGITSGNDSFFSFSFDIDEDKTAEKVSDIIEFDPNTGLITWIAKKTDGENNEVADVDENGAAVRTLAALIRAYLDAHHRGNNEQPGIQADVPDKTTTAATDTTDDENLGNPIVIDNLPLGYYFITTMTGSICSLDTTAKDVTIGDKNAHHTQNKEQAEDNGTVFADTDNSAAIGDIVKYQVTVKIQPGAESLCLHDKMTEGLTFNNDVKVVDSEGKELKAAFTYTPESGKETASTPGYDYSENSTHHQYLIWSTANDEADMADCADPHCTFHVAFQDEYLHYLTKQAIKENPTNPAATELKITYTATVNEDAVIYADEEETNDESKENSNKSRLTWGHDMQTTWDKVKTHVFEFTGIKYTGDSKNPTYLAGAEFELYKDEACTQKVEFDLIVDYEIPDDPDDLDGPEEGGNEEIALAGVEIDDGEEGPEHDVYRVCVDSTHTGNQEVKRKTKIETDETGKFNIEGLDAKAYYLKEIKAPDGYNKLAFPLKVDIAADNTVKVYKATAYNSDSKTYTWDTDNEKVVTATGTENEFMIENNTGTELPSTGGMGTTLFYVVGGLLVLGAAVLLVTKKRTNI